MERREGVMVLGGSVSQSVSLLFASSAMMT